MERVKDILEYRDGDKYKFDAKELADFFGVTRNTIYSSRATHLSQRPKIEHAEKAGRKYLGDKYDVYYAHHKARQLLENSDKGVIGGKDDVIDSLSAILKPEKKYQIFYKEI
jgi:hypothetical protein